MPPRPSVHAPRIKLHHDRFGLVVFRVRRGDGGRVTTRKQTVEEGEPGVPSSFFQGLVITFC